MCAWRYPSMTTRPNRRKLIARARMGVADISWWTSRPVLRRGGRNAERCCLSTMVKPKLWNATPGKQGVRADGDFDAVAGEFGFGFVLALRKLPKATTSMPKGSSHCLNLIKNVVRHDFSGRAYSHLRTGFDGGQRTRQDNILLLPTSPCSRRHRVGLRLYRGRFRNNFFFAHRSANGRAWRRA